MSRVWFYLSWLIFGPLVIVFISLVFSLSVCVGIPYYVIFKSDVEGPIECILGFWKEFRSRFLEIFE